MCRTRFYDFRHLSIFQKSMRRNRGLYLNTTVQPVAIPDNSKERYIIIHLNTHYKYTNKTSYYKNN